MLTTQLYIVHASTGAHEPDAVFSLWEKEGDALIEMKRMDDAQTAALPTPNPPITTGFRGEWGFEVSLVSINNPSDTPIF